MRRDRRMEAGLVCAITTAITTAQAQLAVTVSPPKVTGQKAVVHLTLKNHLGENIESARALCFLLDDQEEMVGQSTKWVIGGSASKAGLPTGTTNNFNFVITSPKPFTTTNLTAKISFSQLVLENGKPANVKASVQIEQKDSDAENGAKAGFQTGKNGEK